MTYVSKTIGILATTADHPVTDHQRARPQLRHHQFERGQCYRDPNIDEHEVDWTIEVNQRFSQVSLADVDPTIQPRASQVLPGVQLTSAASNQFVNNTLRLGIQHLKAPNPCSPSTSQIQATTNPRQEMTTSNRDFSPDWVQNSAGSSCRACKDPAVDRTPEKLVTLGYTAFSS